MPVDTPAAPAAPAAPAPAPVAPAPAPAAPAAPSASAGPAPSGGSDYDLSSIPEQFRPHVEPVIKKATEKYQSELSKQQEAVKAFQDKSMALDRLLADQDFQRWYMDKTNPQARQPQQPAQPEQPVVSPEEWQSAYDKALAGDMAAMNDLTERQLDSLVQKKYAPEMQRMALKQRQIDLSMEMNELFNSHPDAKDLDKAGLLEPALHLYTDKNKKPMEHAYQEARKAYDFIYNKAKADLTAEAQGKRGAITETPSTTTNDATTVYVDTPQQALRQQLLAAHQGLKVTYRVRPKK